MNIRINRTVCIMITLLLVSACMAIPGNVYASNTDVDEINVISEDVARSDPASADYKFSSQSAGKTVKIVPTMDGTIYLFSSHKMKVTTPSGDVVKDQGHDVDDEDCYYLTKAKKGDNYLIQVPAGLKANETFNLTAYMYPDNVQNIADNKEYVQSGTNGYTYSYFNIPTRSKKTLNVFPHIINSDKDVYFSIQKKENGTWKTVTKQRISRPDYDSNHEFTFAFKKGTYRAAFKTSDKQVFSIITMTKSYAKSKYKTTKSKAQSIKYKKKKTNVFTVTEKKARYYKVYKGTSKKRIISITVHVNSGTVKAKIYKKGSKKCIKTLTLKNDYKSYEDYVSDSYRLKNGKGTYYIKIIKTGKNMNGEYTIKYK